MRRFAAFIILSLLVLTSAALLGAEEVQSTKPTNNTISIPDIALINEISGDEWTPIELRSTTAILPPADMCAAATGISLPLETVLSSYSSMNLYTNESTDPPIGSCMRGTSPSSTKGYRTAWYTFIAPTTGLLHVKTSDNFDYDDNYDTIIAIHEGSCGSFQTVSCNDDSSGFLSEVEMVVEQGTQYYIEIADHQIEVQGETKLAFEIWIESESFWSRGLSADSEDWLGLVPQANRSRHSTVAYQDNIYVFGGQTTLNPVTATVRTESVEKFDTVSKEWSTMNPFPVECAENGYSNTDSALVNGKVYFPAGYVGNNSIASGNHCVYDIANNSWEIEEPAPWANDAVAYAATAARPDGEGYYVTGGINGVPGRLLGDDTIVPDTRKEVYYYSSNFGYWETNFPDLPEGRFGHTSTFFQYTERIRNPNGSISEIEYNELCIAGGITLNSAGDDIEMSPAMRCLDLNNPSEGWNSLSSPTTNSLNQPRAFADSAIGPDGRWYVIGGITVEGGVVLAPEIEGYDQETNQWITLDRRYNIEAPARLWPRGEFVNNNLYLIGGETFSGNGWVDERQLTGLLQVAPFEEPEPAAPYQMYLPIIYGGVNRDGDSEPNNSTFTAQPIPFGEAIAGNFNTTGDIIDMYITYLNEPGGLDIELKSVDERENVDVYLYDSHKRLRGKSTNPSNLDELIEARNLPADTYYIIVVSAVNHPNVTDNYQIKLFKK